MSDNPVATPSDESRVSRISAPPVTALHERYEIVRETGRGASAIVYLARDLKHDRLVALKMLSPDVSHTAGERFLREIQLAAGMQHPHILPMYDSGVTEGRLYFVMPFVDGGSLRQRLEAEPQLPIAEALRVAHDISLALQFAHDQGVIHRDVKPENIMFYHGHACLADFGVARAMEELDTRVTAHGMIVGTPAYMSPEQLTDGGFDGRSDVYSLACVLYETIAGVHAFSGSTPRELLRQRLRTPPPPLLTHRTDAPKCVEDIMTRALAASPDARYADAREFADAIEKAQLELTKPQRRSSGSRVLEMPRSPIAWAGSLALLVALGGLAATPIRNAVKSYSSRGIEGNMRVAKNSFAAGNAAFERWDLPTAEQELTRAVTANPKMAEAQLKLAQTLELERRVDGDQFKLAAARLTTLRGSLRGRDSLLAGAMIAMASRRYPAACETFTKMRAADSLDALAWYGLGDCMVLDSTVAKDAASPSGWSFRTSWYSAANAYMRAALIEPGVHRALSFTFLAKLLPTAPANIRVGRLDDTSRAYMPAYPELLGDTIGYVPVTPAVMASMAPPHSLLDAHRKNRDALVAFARQWTKAEPSNPEAFGALAAGFEARGELASDSTGAVGAIMRAESLQHDQSRRDLLRTIAVRLFVKRGEFETARALADSLIAGVDVTNLSTLEAERLVGLAALTGRLDLMGKLRARSTESQYADLGIAPALTAASGRLFARAALGVCDDSLLTLRKSVDQLLDSYSQPTRRAQMRWELLERSTLLAYPCLGAMTSEDSRPSYPVVRVQRALVDHDRRKAAFILDSIANTRANLRPGDVAIDITVQEALVYLALGDTASATHRLDLVLNALPTLGNLATREEGQSAAIGRALALRAELASKSGDFAVRRQRAREALALWQHADPVMSPTIARLRVLASPTR